MTDAASRWGRHGGALLLLAAAGAVYATTLTSHPMFTWDEAEYAVLSRSLVRGEGLMIGDHLSSLRPPLLPLAGAVAILLGGTADDATVKLATVCLALLALAVVYAATSVAYDVTTGLFAAFLLATEPEFWSMTPRFLSEMPYLAFFSAAVLGFELGLRRDARWFWFSWLGWALALLTRYNAVLFAAFVVARLALARWLHREQEWERVRSTAFVASPLLAASIVGLWLVRQQVVFGDALVGFKQASQQLQTYVPGVSMPWSFYITRLPDMLSPMTTALLAVGVVAAILRRDGLALSCTLVIAALVLWFSVYRYKEVRLVTAILPFAAVVAAAGIAQMLRGRRRLLLAALAVVIFGWNWSLVASTLARRTPLGYPALLETLTYVRQHASPKAVVMGASSPQIAWYADRRDIDFPERAELSEALAACEWVVFNSYERAQKAYAVRIARRLLAAPPGDAVAVFANDPFPVLAARADFVREQLDE